MAKLALLVLVVALLVNAFMESRDTKPAEVDIGRLVETPVGDVQVRADGPARAPALVLLHCYTCSMRWWDGITPALARTRRVVRVDLIGHGGSEKPRDGYAVEDQARAVAAALRAEGVRRATVVGQSFGAPVATALAEARPELVRRIAVLDGLPSTDYRSLPFTAELSYLPVIGQALRRTAPDVLVEEGLSEAFADEGYDVPDQFVADVNRMTYTSYEETPDAANAFVEERPLPDRLAELGKPLLVIFGEEDDVVSPAREAAREYRRVPGAQIHLLPDVGHTPQVEAPVATARLLLRFSR
jgi:pimeloyl-ACP methyl ester carboxylesterase